MGVVSQCCCGVCVLFFFWLFHLCTYSKGEDMTLCGGVSCEGHDMIKLVIFYANILVEYVFVLCLETQSFHLKKNIFHTITNGCQSKSLINTGVYTVFFFL